MNYINTYEEFLIESNAAVETAVKNYTALKYAMKPGNEYPSNAHTNAAFIKAKDKLIQMTKSEKLATEIKDLLGDEEFDVLTK